MNLFKLEYSYKGYEKPSPIELVAYASNIEDLEAIVDLLGDNVIYEKYSKVSVDVDRIDTWMETNEVK